MILLFFVASDASVYWTSHFVIATFLNVIKHFKANELLFLFATPNLVLFPCSSDAAQGHQWKPKTNYCQTCVHLFLFSASTYLKRAFSKVLGRKCLKRSHRRHLKQTIQPFNEITIQYDSLTTKAFLHLINVFIKSHQFELTGRSFINLLVHLVLIIDFTCGVFH